MDITDIQKSKDLTLEAERSAASVDLISPVIEQRILGRASLPGITYTHLGELFVHNVATITIATGDYSYSVIRSNSWLSRMSAMLADVRRRFGMTRFNVELFFQTNNTFQHQGLLGMYWIPTDKESYFTFMYNTISFSRAQQLFYMSPPDRRTSLAIGQLNQCSLTVPFLHELGFFPSHGNLNVEIADEANAWPEVHLLTLSPLYAPASVSQNITVTIHARVKDLHYGRFVGARMTT